MFCKKYYRFVFVHVIYKFYKNDHCLSLKTRIKRSNSSQVVCTLTLHIIDLVKCQYFCNQQIGGERLLNSHPHRRLHRTYPFHHPKHQLLLPWVFLLSFLLHYHLLLQQLLQLQVQLQRNLRSTRYPQFFHL